MAEESKAGKKAFELGRLHGFYDFGETDEWDFSGGLLRGRLSESSETIRQYLEGYRDGFAARRQLRLDTGMWHGSKGSERD